MRVNLALHHDAMRTTVNLPEHVLRELRGRAAPGGHFAHVNTD